MPKREYHSIRCHVCGKFIGYKEIPDEVEIKYTPDSNRTVEETLFAHNKCIRFY